MLKYFFATVLLLPGFAVAGGQIGELLHAIHMVESNGQLNPPDGDSGKAIGPYQIWRAYWKDAYEFDNTLGGSYEDCRDKAYSEKVMKAYWRRYVAQAYREGNFEILARVHNGGPRGYEKEATLKYWGKVKAFLPKERK